MCPAVGKVISDASRNRPTHRQNGTLEHGESGSCIEARKDIHRTPSPECSTKEKLNFSLVCCETDIRIPGCLSSQCPDCYFC